MGSLSPVVWHEGMHLAQHHFQAQARYFEELGNFLFSNALFRSYGFLAYELDAEALRNGTVSLTHARGVMPDGLPFHFPADPPPSPLDIREIFSPVQESHRVLLTIPKYRPGRANCALDGDPDAGDHRFVAQETPVADEIGGRDEHTVPLARKNFRLVLDAEEPEAGDDAVAMPVARVRRDGAGNFVYDEAFIPPSLQVGASPGLTGILARLVGMLEQKAQALVTERADAGGSGAHDIAGFWFSHAVNSGLAGLQHHMRARNEHPERLFHDMLRLGGALCTFSLRSNPRELPAYDHDDLTRSFGELDRHIRDHLGLVLPTSRVSIALQPMQELFYSGAVADRRCFGAGAHWYLGVRSGGGGADLAARAARLVKVCSARHIVRLVQEAYPGLTLEPVAAPPAEVSPRAGFTYFQLHRTDPCWRTIVDSGEVGVYVPGGIPDPELDLVVVLDS